MICFKVKFMSFDKSISIIQKSLLKRYFIYFHYVLLLVLFSNTILFYLEDSILHKFLFLIFLCDLFVTLVIYKLDYDIISPYVNPYLIVVFLFLWYLCLTVWLYNPSILIFFVLFPFGTYTLFSKKVVVYWGLASFFAVFLTVFIIRDFFLINIPKTDAALSSIKIVLSFALIFGFIFYYNSILIKALYSNFTVDDYLSETVSVSGEIEENVFEENEILFYNELYKKIESFFLEKEPWKDPNYSVQDLAYSLQTNSTYISRAINLNFGMNFKNFVNTYRVEFIKNEIQNNKEYSRYKLVYLYSQAGFKHQSTFNKVFKKMTNTTPSEYINLLTQEKALDED